MVGCCQPGRAGAHHGHIAHRDAIDQRRLARQGAHLTHEVAAAMLNDRCDSAHSIALTHRHHALEDHEQARREPGAWV
ncbi:hypothetical protein D9M68_655410 [compost metagenome]